jgi:imidazolonepropionase-like amidohydrolase
MRPVLLVLSLVLASCSQTGTADVQVIVGATVVDAAGKVAIPYSVVVVKDGKIAAAGPQSEVPVPRDSAKTNGIGKFLVPAAPGRRIEVGQPADLLLVAANPVTDPGYRDKIERRMKAGRWVEQ